MAERLPRWTMIIAAYLEVMWLYLALKASFVVLFGSPKWIEERRIVVWLDSVRDEVFSHLTWLRPWWNEAGSIVGSAASVLALALAWLAVASVVYGTPFTPTWAGARRVLLGEQAGAAVGVIGARRRWPKRAETAVIRQPDSCLTNGAQPTETQDALKVIKMIGIIPWCVIRAGAFCEILVTFRAFGGKGWPGRNQVNRMGLD